MTSVNFYKKANYLEIKQLLHNNDNHSYLQ
jgi:hypothetical protein